MTCWLDFAGIILIFYSYGMIHADNGSSLVTFGELSQVVLKNYGLEAIEAIAEDKTNPGGFIVADKNCVIVVTPDLTVEPLAGQRGERDHHDGVGEDAIFQQVFDVIPYRRGAEILAADYQNHCIRKITRSIGNVTTFAGKCGQSSTELVGTQPVSDALLHFPVKVLYVQEQNALYYLLKNPNDIIRHDLTNGTLTSVFRDPTNFQHAYSMVADSNYEYLYVTHHGGISKIDVKRKRRALVAGTIKDGSLWSKDGPLLEARFLYLTGMAWLIPDQVLIVGQWSNGPSSLRIVNIVDDWVSTICTTKQSNNRKYTKGGPDSCGVFGPTRLTVIDRMVYLGDKSHSKLGYMLKLEYHQPICLPPTRYLNGTFSPALSRYTHQQVISFTCDSGLARREKDRTLQCIRAHHNNGTVYGSWDRNVTTCQVPVLSSVRPVTGQRYGGTIITMEGTFPDDEVAVYVEYSDGHRTAVNLTSHSNNLIKVVTPAKRPKSHDNVTIHVVFGSVNTTTEARRAYTYLPNPSITHPSRNGSIARGGLQMTFRVNNILSASNYTLVISRYAGSAPISTTLCTPVKNLVKCDTPNLEALFIKRVTRSADGIKTLELRANIYFDGKRLPGDGSFPFRVTNTIPTFTPFKGEDKRIDLRISSEVVLEGDEINTSLVASDYTVALRVQDTEEKLYCSVRSIERTKLRCSLPTDDIKRSSFVTSTHVKVANLNISAGYIEFYTSSPTPKPITHADLTGVITAAVLIALMILVAIGLFFIIRKKFKKSFANISAPGSTELPCDTMKQLLPVELRQALEDMYIDSKHLYFDLMSDPIGAGQFGKVYVGQLQVKGNVLKTVAVKTFKETEDVNVKQIQEFLEEASFLKDYKHVNVLNTVGIVWKKRDRPIVVLPYMALGDLCALVRKPDMLFTNGDLLHFGMQVACGLEYLSSNKRLHRDIAARNCLVNDGFLVKIADFGMSKDVYTQSYYRETSKDKPKPVKWMAVESLTDAIYNTQTEVWSFGVLMWELLTRGHMPYPDVPNSEISLHLLSGHRLPRPSYTHPIVFDEIAQCWDIDPLKRPSFAYLREFFENCITKGQRPEELPLYNSDEDNFQYSYATDHTSRIPQQYWENESYVLDASEASTYSYYVDKEDVFDDNEVIPNDYEIVVDTKPNTPPQPALRSPESLNSEHYKYPSTDTPVYHNVQDERCTVLDRY